MAERPTELPDWATAPAGGSLTAPSTVQRASGWATFRLIRQYVNWFWNLTYQWLAWLSQVTHRTDYFSDDQALPGGTPPAIGAGLNILANAFSARVFVDGYELGPITGPTANYTYSANSDTYWDLSRAGVWTPVVVASGASEPAVTATSKRVYRVRTNATDRTTLVDRRRTNVAITETVDVSGKLRLVPEGLSANVTGASTLGERLNSQVTYYLDEVSGGAYQALPEILSNGSLGPVRVYARMTGAGVSAGMTLVWGAHLTAATTWYIDVADVYRLDLAPDGSTEGMWFARRTGLTPGSNFADADWWTETAANTTRMQLPINAGLKVGGAPFGQATGANANRQALIQYVRSASARTMLTADLTATEKSCVEYASTDNREMVFNALWNEGTSQWDRTAAGDSWMVVLADNGFRIDHHDSAAAASWGSWNSALAVFDGFVQVYEDLDVNGSADISDDLAVHGHLSVAEVSDTPVLNGIYADMFAKARGTVLVDTSGAITLGATGPNYTAAIVDDGFGRDVVELTFLIGFDSTSYQVKADLAYPHYGLGRHISVEYVSATVAELHLVQGDGTIDDFGDGVARRVDFVVFGRQ